MAESLLYVAAHAVATAGCMAVLDQAAPPARRALCAMALLNALGALALLAGLLLPR